MSSRRFAAALPALLLLAAAPSTAQQVYKWTDANGVNHYSSTPPPRGDYESRNVQLQDPAAPAADPAPAEDPECRTARENLALLDGDAPLQVDSDGDGTLDKTLDEADRQQQRTAAEAALVRCARAAAAPEAAGD